MLERAARLERHALSARAWSDLGNHLANDGELPAAQEANERAFAVAEDDAVAEIQCNLGAVFIRQKNCERAEAPLRSAMQSRHKEASVAAGVYLAVALIRRKRLEGATATLVELMDLVDSAAGRTMLTKMIGFENDRSAHQLDPRWPAPCSKGSNPKSGPEIAGPKVGVFTPWRVAVRLGCTGSRG